MSERNRDTDLLKSVRIFRELTEAEIKGLREQLHPLELDKDQTLFRQGDEGGELFVVQSGKLGIAVTLEDGKNLEIATFKQGDFFGEMSIFEEEARSATCYAKSRSRLLGIRKSEFVRFIDSNPAAAAKVMTQMLEVTRSRLDDTDGFLSDMVQWGEQARKRAISDPLTGLYNRRYLEEALEEHFAKAKAGSGSLCLVMLDLDHFRRINESFTEKAGDRVLVAAAEIFQQHLRDSDVAARYGGDEFTFILPDTDLQVARTRMEQLRAAVGAADLLGDLGYKTEASGESLPRVTTSQGLACYPDHAADVRSLREAADAALYRAKELGRNRIVEAARG